MCCNPLSWLVQLLRRLCGGGGSKRKADRHRDEEQERLLHPGFTSAPVQQQISPADAQSRQHTALDSSAVLPEEYTTTIIVMRHGHRQDEEDPFWHSTASRPWDPPLSVKGRVQATEVASKLAGYSIDYVITSPFRRCLQTSAGLVKQLQHLEQGHWLVDWQLSEICDPRVLFAGRPDLKQQANEAVDSWMWKGTGLQATLDKFSNEETKLSKVHLQPVPRTTPLPHYPEDLNQGLKRYSVSLQEIGRTYAGKTVLVVTHGECVRMAVLLGEPYGEVFEVKHTGFVVLQQHVTTAAAAAGGRSGPISPAGSRKKEPWKLVSEPGETGVLWLEEDVSD